MEAHRYLLFCIVLCIAHVVYASDTDCNDYDQIEFNFDFDILGDMRLLGVISQGTECMRRLCGFDSTSYKAIKETYRNPGQRIELLLALLMIEKYPVVQSLEERNNKVIEEIKLGEFSEDQEKLLSALNNIVKTTQFIGIYNKSTELSQRERVAIICQLRSQISLDAFAASYSELSSDKIQLLYDYFINAAVSVIN